MCLDLLIRFIINFYEIVMNVILYILFGVEECIEIDIVI